MLESGLLASITLHFGMLLLTEAARSSLNAHETQVTLAIISLQAFHS